MNVRRVVSVVLADDDILVVDALADVFGSAPGFVVRATCTDGWQLRVAVDAHRPDLVVTDYRMPGGGDDLIRDLAQVPSSPAVLVYTASGISRLPTDDGGDRAIARKGLDDPLDAAVRLVGPRAAGRAAV